jgi:gliding motility-associated-like protein
MITTSYILLATDTTTGCIKRDTVKVEAANLLETSAGNDVILCKGQIAAIGMPAIEGNTYTWTDGQNTLSNTNATITVQPTTTTTYYLTEVDTVKGCTSTDSVIVLITNLKGITKLQDQVLCKGTSTKVGMSSIPGYTYNWLPTNDLDDAQAASVVITPEASSTYTVSITDGFCTERDTLHVKVIQPVDLTSEETHYVCTGSNVVLGGAAVADKKYQWEPATYLDNSNTSQVIVSPQSNITYTLTVSDKEFGCEQKATIHIEMSDESFFNTFSPNGDGVNDYWHIPMLKCHPTNTVSIVSQNGEKVWEANNYDSETILWNGESMSGETLPDATYYYVIRYDQFEKRGWILIKR